MVILELEAFHGRYLQRQQLLLNAIGTPGRWGREPVSTQLGPRRIERVESAARYYRGMHPLQLQPADDRKRLRIHYIY